MRSATTPVSNDRTNERGSEADGEEEVFYVNVTNDGGEDMYQMLLI